MQIETEQIMFSFFFKITFIDPETNVKSSIQVTHTHTHTHTHAHKHTHTNN